MFNFFNKKSIFVLFLFFLLFLISGRVFAQTEKDAAQYDPAEFPQWAKDFRRFDIIALGSFPFAFFTASFITDSARFFQHNNNMTYAPWPLKPAGAYDPTTEEKLITIGVAAGISLSVALIDLIIVHIKRHKRKKAYIPPANEPIINRTPREKSEN